MNEKGVSPLIASVLLIAVTMAIAGVMATWATTFTSSKIQDSSSGANCIGAIDVSSPQFSNTTVSVRIRNTGERINLTALKASVNYEDAKMSREINLRDYNASDSLSPGQTTWLIYDTGLTTRPNNIEIIASNCIKYPGKITI
jgi:flagellin-like protein